MRSAVLLGALLIWHQTYVLWHLAGNEHHLSGHGHTAADTASPGRQHSHSRAQVSSGLSVHHAHTSSNEAPDSHFGPLFHKLHHEFAHVGLASPTHDHFHAADSPGHVEQTDPTSHPHDSDENHQTHSAGDHLAGYFSGDASEEPNFLAWVPSQVRVVEAYPEVQQPYFDRASARAPPPLG